MRRVLMLAFVAASMVMFVACGEDPRTTDIVSLSRDAVAGKTLYDANCASCHGADGAGGAAGPNIKGEDGEDEIVDKIINGDGAMPAFGDKLDDQEIADTLGYVLTL